MTNLEGQTFAGYEIIAKLGQGGMGAVYKARQPRLDRIVALKVMSSDLASDRDFVARFKREASAAASLNHENIVQVFSAGEFEGGHFIAMEFVEGTTLRHHIESQGRLDPREAIAITILAAQALQHAWNKARLIHRDIKPDNIFLSHAGEVKVGDLGLAKTVGGSTTSLTQTGTAMGSPHYISPEQATGAKEMDFRTDIYSLGGTLYHMLTGQTPYQGDSSMVVMMKHVNDPPPAIFKVWPQCPMPLGLLVGKMLAKNRNSRPASYEDLIEQLRELHDKLKPVTVPAAAPISPSDPTQLLTPTPKPAPAPAQPTPRPVVTKTPTVAPKARKSKPVTRNSRLVIGAGALAAVALIAGAVWWFAGSGGGPKVLDLGDGVKMELVAIPPGEFMLGITKEEREWASAKSEGEQRRARIRNAFWMSRTETTFGQWKRFVNATGYKSEVERENRKVNTWNPVQKKWEERTGVTWRDPGFGFPLQDNHPACCITWGDAMAFCDWLTQRELEAGRLPAGYKFRLPTEAEREYACRGGTQTRFWWGDSAEDSEGRVNWNGDNDGFECVSTADHYGARGRNGFGLADMLGNVAEWCLDSWDASEAHEELYRGESYTHVQRGGDFSSTPQGSRCAIRYAGHLWSSYGFRVCLGPDVLGSAAAAPAATAEPQVAPPAAVSPKFGTLFDGRDTSAWQQRDGGDCQWQVSDGALVAGKGDLDTREKFQDFKLHIEFAVPRDTKQGNSGIYLQGRYEVQILDSFGKPADDACCGSIFRLKAPTENASKPADEWQTFDIGFRAAQFDATGAKTANARVSVAHNGRLIHDYAEIPKSTGKGEPESAAPGPIRLQSYGSPVRFRNISIRPVDEAAAAAPVADGAWIPLDISAACNRSTINPELGKPIQAFGLTGNSWVTTGWLRARGSDNTGVPDDGRVAIPGANPTGFFQLRVGPGNDSIVVDISPSVRAGDIPTTVTLNVPASQQRKFARLAFLHASEPGDAEVSVTIHYDTDADGEGILHPRAWAPDRRKEPLTENETAVRASDASKRPVDMMAETLPVDPQRVLKSLTITFKSVSPKCNNPLAAEKCRAGIFAISALPSAPTAPTSADAAWQNAINLLPLVDIEKDKVSGTWTAANGELTATDVKAASQKLQPPYQPPQEYDCRVSFTPTGGMINVAAGLSVAGHSFVCLIKTNQADHLMGFEMINGKPVRDNTTGVSIPHLECGRRYTMTVEVRKESVTAYLDGKRMTEWKTDYRDMGPWRTWKFKDDTLLGIGCVLTTAIFHEMKVREVTGKGTFTRGAPPTADAGWQNAINLLPLIDPQKDAVAGDWTVRNGELASDAVNYSRVEFPYRPPAEYDFRMEFSVPGAKKTGPVQFLSKAGRDFRWQCFCRPNSSFGFEAVGGTTIHESPAKVELPLPMQNDRHYVSLVEVRNGVLRGYLDGKLCVEWKTDYTDMDIPAQWKLRSSGVLGVGSQVPTTFHRVEVREVTGKGTFTRGAPAPSSPATAGDAVNLLALASVPRDAVYGNWSVTADGLAVQQANGATALEFPYDAPEEYDYEIEFTPQGNGMNVNQYLSAGGHAFAWKLNSHGVSPPLYGFELLDGKYAKDHLPEAGVQKPMRIESGKRYTSKVEVRRGSLRALVNGEEYATWSGDFSRLSMEPHTKMKDERHLGVGSWKRGVVFHRAEVRKVGQSSAPAAWLSAFCAEVAALPAEQQVARVVAKLKEINPEFDPAKAKLEHKIGNGQVVEFTVREGNLKDLSPIRALSHLQSLDCRNNPLEDLSPLRGLALTRLGFSWSRVSDLSPLRGMPLTDLDITTSPVADLSPLQGMKLTRLGLWNTPVSDLTPLRGMQLVSLNLSGAVKVSDLSPLRGMPLEWLSFLRVPVANLSPLADMAGTMKHLGCNFGVARRNQDMLRRFPMLETVTTRQYAQPLSAAEFFKLVEASELPNTPARLTPADDAAWQNAISLLPLVDLQKDRVGGNWKQENNELVSDLASGSAQVSMPYQPPNEYDFRIVFTRRGGDGDVVQILPHAGRAFTWKLGAYENTWSGFDEISENGARVDLIQASPTVVQSIENGRRYTMQIQIRKEGVRTYLDGSLVTWWKTNYQDLTVPYDFRLQDQNAVGIGSWKSEVVFHRIEVREITGRGRLTRPAP